MEKILLNSLDEIQNASNEFISLIGNHKVFAFKGEMGAGKTTFIKAVCQTLGVDDNITSPTFSIVNEYEVNEEDTIYHFDCYRLKDINEAFDIGADDYLYSGNLCFIEWPEKIFDLLPESTINVEIRVLENQSREIFIDV